MSMAIAVWMALPIILAAQQETQDDSKQRSMAEVAMLQNLSGDWSIDVVLVGGKKHEGKVSVAGARITDHKMTFLDTRLALPTRSHIVENGRRPCVRANPLRQWLISRSDDLLST